MSKSELAWRSLHDIGLAGWFGGSVFGSVALPRYSSPVPDPSRRPSAKKPGDTPPGAVLSEIEAVAWQRWTPALAASMIAHLAGGAGLLAWNWQREKHQSGVTASTVAKTALTVAAVGLTLGAVADGLQSERLRQRSAEGTDDAEARQSRDRIERRTRVVGPLIPATTGALVVLGALEGEQQRPREMVKGFLASARDALPGVA
jgi:uncharacterized protein (DUF697 family)